MSMTQSPSVTSSAGADVNAIAWAQFQLRGGWMRWFMTVGGYGLVVGVGLVILLRLAATVPPLLGVVKGSLLGVQAGVVVLFACARVSGAVRADLTSKLIESHRLMPMSPAAAVLGYLIGPPSFPLGIGLANLVMGSLMCQSLGLSLALWLTANLVLFSFGAFAVTIACFGSFVGKPGAVAIGWIAASIGMVNIWTIGGILPAVNVLITPLNGSTVFALQTAGGDAVATYAPSWVFQAWIGGVLFAGACRRYRRDDRPALGADLGLALLAGWVGASAMGIVHWENFEPTANRWMSEDPASQFLGSVIVAMLAALVPIAGAAWAAVDWAGRRAVGDTMLGRRPWPPQVVAVAAAGVTMVLAAVASTMTIGPAAPLERSYLLPRTAVILLAFYVAMAYVLRVLARVTTKLLLPLMAWVLITWLAPLTVDYGLWWVRGADEGDALMGAVSGLSPVGAMVQVWTGRAELTTVGLVSQCVMAAVLAAVFYGTEPRWARGGKVGVGT